MNVKMKTNMKKYSIFMIIVAALVLVFGSCIKDLDTVPLDSDEITSATVYDNPDSYKQVLAKLYAVYAVSGQQGPAGMPDISGIDEGFSNYLRQYWLAQELTTDEAVIAWNDGSLVDYHEMDWTATSEFVTALYNRIYYEVSLSNEFIRESTEAKLDERGITGETRTAIQQYRAEARFLRSLSYYHALDMFGSVPFVTELDKVGAFFPTQISRADLFDYIESELLDIEATLALPRTNEYARADQAAAWMVLAKLYLNAEIYNGTNRYDDAVIYSKKVIDAGFSLEPNYADNFVADNNLSNEIIFPIAFDGVHTKTWGGTTFLIHAAVGGSMSAADYGIDGGWGGTRTTSAFVHKFYPDLTKSLLVSPVPTKATNAYPLLYVPGGHNGWDPSNTTTVLASVNSDNFYEGYLYFADANNNFKINATPNWDQNYGDTGADGTLDQNGDNIAAGDAGYYKINVDFDAKTYTLLLTDWGIIGSATADGWISDQNMTFDPATGLWSAELFLNVGEIKFRANNGWDINLGDTGVDGILEGGGDNIAIADAGNYLITLKLGSADYTYTLERSSVDSRAMFHTDGQSLDIADIHEFTEGFAIAKFKNLTSAGAVGSDLTFPDTDFPMFRLADAYLMYAEAVLRGGNGDAGLALDYINAVINRGFGDNSAQITAAQLTLDFILDERARELYWEGHRRTDLVRFGKFTTADYLWPWKGNVADGSAIDSKYNVFPIPATDIGANPNLVQNTGY